MKAKRGMGALSLLLPAFFTVLLVGLVSTYLLDINQDVADDQKVDGPDTNQSYAYNASKSSLKAGANMTDKLTNISNIIIAVIIVSLLIWGFASGRLQFR